MADKNIKATPLDECDKSFKELREKWFSIDPKNEIELFDFIHDLTAHYVHDYGTAVHATVAIMRAVLEYVNHLEGFTGFQVSCMMWEAIKHVFLVKDKIGMRLQKCEHVLYPQFDRQFKTLKLNKSQREALVALAKKNLEEAKKEGYPVSKNVLKRWKKIAKGKLPRYIKKEAE